MKSDSVQKGFFIAISSEDALSECLRTGIYGQLVDYTEEVTDHHLRILADYASASPGDHVFFFRERTIYYGGQLVESEDGSAVYLSGAATPLDVSSPDRPHIPERYMNRADDHTGVFEYESQYGTRQLCQPYVFAFDDRLGLRGQELNADEFYNRLNRLPFPVPSTEMSNAGFCAITPGETNLLLRLFRETDRQLTLGEDSIPPSIDSLEPLSFDTLRSPAKAESEAEIEATLLAQPELLPGDHASDVTYIRQVPMSAARPDTDSADICVYDQGSYFPQTVYELKYKQSESRVGKSTAEQVQRYLRFAQNQKRYKTPTFWVFAPEFTETFTDYLSPQQRQYIHMHEYRQPATTLADF